MIRYHGEAVEHLKRQHGEAAVLQYGKVQPNGSIWFELKDHLKLKKSKQIPRALYLDPQDETALAEIDKQARAEAEGLGDTLHGFIKAVGADKAAKLFERITGLSCGCPERRAWLNKVWPYKNVKWPREITIRTEQGWGDIIGLSGAVRDLREAHPGRYRLQFHGSWSEWFDGNPDFETHGNPDPLFIDEHVKAYETLVHADVRRYVEPGVTFHGLWHDALAKALDVTVPVLHPAGAVYLSPEEKALRLPVPSRYCVIALGGANNFPTKWWDVREAQKVVDHFADRLPFVVTGYKGQLYCPKVERAVDLRGKLSMRELTVLISRSTGLVCQVSGPMHAAAALGMNNVVVVGGGRETPEFYRYPGQAVLHSVGKLDCCESRGCWAQSIKDCKRPVAGHEGVQLVQCMADVKAEQVIEEIEKWLVH